MKPEQMLEYVVLPGDAAETDMELLLYLKILRRHWGIVLALPLVVGLLSTLVALRQPARYSATAQLLVTRPLYGNLDGDDTLAYDLPAIVGGTPFAQDVVAELARRNHPLDQALIEQALHAENQRHVVTIRATTAQPDDALAIVQAAVALIETNGRRYWGERDVTPERPGVNVAVLEAPTAAVLQNGPRALAFEVGLRTLLGLLAGIGLAFALHYLNQGRVAALQFVERTSALRDEPVD